MSGYAVSLGGQAKSRRQEESGAENTRQNKKHKKKDSEGTNTKCRCNCTTPAHRIQLVSNNDEVFDEYRYLCICTKCGPERTVQSASKDGTSNDHTTIDTRQCSVPMLFPNALCGDCRPECAGIADLVVTIACSSIEEQV